MTCAVDRYIWEHGVEPDDYEPSHNCYECGEALPDSPTEIVKARDKILEWETVIDGEGVPYSAPLEWSYVDEPVWKCEHCGHENTLSELY